MFSHDVTAAMLMFANSRISTVREQVLSSRKHFMAPSTLMLFHLNASAHPFHRFPSLLPRPKRCCEKTTVAICTCAQDVNDSVFRNLVPRAFAHNGRAIFLTKKKCLTNCAEKGWFCHQLVINEGFESRARKFAKCRFFQFFVIIKKEPQSYGQLK